MDWTLAQCAGPCQFTSLLFLSRCDHILSYIGIRRSSLWLVLVARLRFLDDAGLAFAIYYLEAGRGFALGFWLLASWLWPSGPGLPMLSLCVNLHSLIDTFYKYMLEAVALDRLVDQILSLTVYL